jgi:hypothetical protein
MLGCVCTPALRNTVTNSKEQVLLEKLILAQLVKKFPAFYGTQNFITVLQKPATGSYSEPDESNPHPFKLFL